MSGNYFSCKERQHQLDVKGDGLGAPCFRLRPPKHRSEHMGRMWGLEPAT